MNKVKYILIAFLISQVMAWANLNEIFVADIQYDWINKSEVEKEAIIAEVHDIIFTEPLEKDKDMHKNFKSRLKDKQFREHYLAASAGYKEYKEQNIAAFYYKNQKNIYMYALQDKEDLTKNFYYDALGHLRYVDYIYGDYPDYPYYCIQYRVSGKPVSAVYYVSKDTQYLFEPDGTFKGLWYKYNLYDKHSKVILKRSAY